MGTRSTEVCKTIESIREGAIQTGYEATTRLTGRVPVPVVVIQVYKAGVNRYRAAAAGKRASGLGTDLAIDD
jgi:hypothetical protein